MLSFPLRGVDRRHDLRRTAAFRTLASNLGTTAAALAHRYALAMDGVDTIVLGCKNREELLECIDAAEAGPLDPSIIVRIDATCSMRN